MTFPETIRRQLLPKETSSQIKIWHLSLPYDLALDLHYLTKDIKEKDKNRLIRAFIALRIALDQVPQNTPDQKGDEPIMVSNQQVSREDLLAKYPPEPKDSQNLPLTRAEVNLARVAAKARGEKTTVYFAEAIALGLELMKAARNQITYPVVIALILGDQGFLFGYQGKQQVLTPINSKPV